ncbi:MAG: hypothetical protein COB02_07610 [Candidatus Cloacimonadota bacterium]|nr:MAG: hypothetical protein COB02_07610 [Candidatus Cloacimonadota bacterium]
MKSYYKSSFTGRIIAFILRKILGLRYKVKIIGLDKIKQNTHTLFLPNHPSHFDPLILTTHLWPRFAPKPMAIEYCFFVPVMQTILKLIGAFPVPNFDEGFSPFKLRRMEKVLDDAGESISKGDNLVIYPAGNLMRSTDDVIGGASGVHILLNKHKDTQVILVRTKGMWGSSGSTAYSGGVSPQPMPLMKRCAEILFQNLLFFTPRRKVEIEFVIASDALPISGDKMEFNRYLDNWYNINGFEKVNKVSYKFYKKEYLDEETKQKTNFDISLVNEDLQDEICQRLAQAASIDPYQVSPEQHLSNDLGLDSLDRSDILAWMEDDFDVKDAIITELQTVGNVMEICFLKHGKLEISDVEIHTMKELRKRPKPFLPKGNTLGEAFLNCCNKMIGTVSISDEATGTLGYTKLKTMAIALSLIIKEMPDKRIGIMLPASVGADVLLFACILAGKTPVMINWTLGSLNLSHVIEVSGVKQVLTSIKFVDRLGDIDLGILDDTFIFLEHLKKEHLSTTKLMKSLILSRFPTKKLMNFLDIADVTKDDEAIILFTSGSESIPKGVPLTHENILTNVRDGASSFEYKANDIIFAFLPPFHSFGLVITTIFPCICGIRTIYYPNPTEAKRIAKGIHSNSATLTYGTPTFLSNIFRSADFDQLQSLRALKSGAEKAPDSLFKLISQKSNARLIEGYGITECSPILTMNLMSKKTSGVGYPFPSVKIKIVHAETMKKIPQDQVGLILTQGPSIFKGYLDKDTKDPFFTDEDGKWYITGDLGYIDKTGAVHIAGRKKRFIKIAGEMISLPSIETQLVEKWPPTDNGPIIAVEALEIADQKPIMCLFTTVHIILSEVNQVLKDSGMGNLSKINHIENVKEIPALGSGKTDYKTLKKMLEDVFIPTS